MSYQAEILPIFLPITFVNDASTIEEAGLWLKSIETSFSSVISKILIFCFLLKSLKAELIFSTDKSFLEQNGLNPSSESLMQDIVSSEEYITKNGL